MVENEPNMEEYNNSIDDMGLIHKHVDLITVGLNGN